MKILKSIGLLCVGCAAVAAMATPGQALTLTLGEYRLIVAEGYTQIVDPSTAAVAGEAFQGNQWGIARINEIQQRNNSGLFDSIWSPGSTVPNPPMTTNSYISVVFGGLTLQPDPLGIAAVNTGVGYNVRAHDPSTHALDYADPNPGGVLPHNLYFIDDTVHGTGPAYVKVFSTAANVFNLDVVATPGVLGGAFGSFAPNTIAGTLLLDFVFDPLALLAQDASGDSVASTGTLGQLRAVANSDTEAGVNAFLQVTGSGAWDHLFDSNSPNYFGADASLDFTTRVLIGSPYLGVGPGQSADPAAAFGWDFRDVGQAQLTVVPEPSTFLLLGAGLLGIGMLGRKRGKK